MRSLNLSGLDAPPPDDDTSRKAPLSAFEEDPNNPRIEFDDEAIASLAEDIRQRGILQPVGVVKLPSGMLRIRFGARRYRASKLIGLASLPYFVVDDDRQLDDYAQMTENMKRKNASPLDTAMFIAKRLAIGDSKTKIADSLGISNADVTFNSSLIDAPDFLLELYHSGKCRNARQLYELRRLHAKHGPAIEQRVATVDELSRKFVDGLKSEFDKEEQADDARSGLPPSSATSIDQAKKTAIPSSKHGAANPPTKSSPNKAAEGAKPTRTKIPQLQGLHENEEVTIETGFKPTRPELVFVRYVGTASLREVACSEVSFSRLVDLAD